MTTLQIKRRHTGAAGAPTSLKSGQQAWNDQGDTLYIGKGNDGNGNATSIVPIGGAVKADAAAVAAGLALKPNATDVTNALSTKADASAVTTGLAAKADAVAVYSKTEVDQKLSDLAGGIAPEALNSITELASKALSGDASLLVVAADVATKAPAATTYTKTEVDDAIAAAVPTGLDDGTF
jgi:hypothetical protein